MVTKEMINTSIDTIKTGQNIKKYRKRKGLSVDKVSKELNLNAVQSVYKWERGDCVPRMDNYLALCVLFNVSLLELLVFCDAEYEKQVKRIMGV